MATIQGKSSDGKTYDIGSEKGQSFISSAAAGTTMTGGDGSTWTKNKDGSTTISKNGTTYTVPGSGGSSSGRSSGSTGIPKQSANGASSSGGNGGGGSGTSKLNTKSAALNGVSPNQTGYSASAAAAAGTGTKATAPVGTSGGNGKVSWEVTGTMAPAGSGSGSAGGSSGGSSGSSAGLTGFTLGAGGLFTDDNGKTYDIRAHTRQPDGTIRNNSTGEIINKQGQVIGRTAQGYEYSSKDYAGYLYGPDGNMRTMTQAEKDALAKAKPGDAFTIGNDRYVVNSDGGLTVTQPDGMVFHSRTADGKQSGVDSGPGSGVTAGDYGALVSVLNGTADGSSLTPVQKELYDKYMQGMAASYQPATPAAASAGMPKGWVEYAYDAEGKPFTMSTQAAYDFLYNSTAKTMTGANGIVFTRNDDGSVTITESGGRTSVWRPGAMYSTYNPSFKTEAQRQAELELSGYDAAYLSPEDQQAIFALKQAWQAADARGDTAAKQNVNQQANNIRAKYGYTAGADGATFQMLQPTAQTMEGFILPEVPSAVTGMNYTPMSQGGNWANALMPASSMENLTRYRSLADTLRPEQLQGYDLGSYQSALEGMNAPPTQNTVYGRMGQVSLGDYGSALGGLSQVPAALQAGDSLPADYQSVLAGMQYRGPSRTGEAALGNVDLGGYQSALAGMQYTPQGALQEQELARTVLPQYQAAYGGLTGPELASRDYSQMENPALQGYEAQTEAVNQVYDAQNAAQLAALRQAYESSRAEAEQGMSKIASAYQQQKNTTAAESEIARRNYREQAAASGLNAGNRGQAALAFSTNLQNNLNQLNAAQANALSDAQFQLDRLQADYQNQISQAIAQNNYERAAALMQEYQTAQQSRVDTAVQQANLNLQTADFNRQVRNDQTDAMQQEFQNRLSIAQGQQADQQAAADLAYRQAALDQQTAKYNREGRQLQRDAAQQDWQNQLALAQMQDAADQDAFNRALQQANLNMDIAAYNREGRNLDWQAAQQEYANYLNFLQAQEAAQQGAFDRNLQAAAFNREGRQMEYDAAMRSYEAALARAQAQDAANQAAWNRAYQQAGLNMDVAQFNRESQTLANQARQQNWENRFALAQAQDAAQQAAWDRAYQQAGLDLNVRQFNQDALRDYYQAQQQDFTNRMAINQEARDAQAQAYDQAYRKAQMDMDSWSLNQDVAQRNFQNRLALAQAQDAAYQAQADRAYQQANLDLSVWDRNRQAEQDLLGRQQQMFDNQRSLNSEQYQRDVFDWQKQQDEMDRKERAAQTERDQEQQKWENEMALTELGAQYGDMNRLSFYGYTPAQMQQMYRFAQMDRLGQILW